MDPLSTKQSFVSQGRPANLPANTKRYKIEKLISSAKIPKKDGLKVFIAKREHDVFDLIHLFSRNKYPDGVVIGTSKNIARKDVLSSRADYKEALNPLKTAKNCKTREN